MDLQKLYDDFVALIDSMLVEEIQRETERAIAESKDSYLVDNEEECNMDCTFINFREKKDKEKIYDNIMKEQLGDEYRGAWIDNDKTYSYGISLGNYCLEVSKPAGVIYRICFADDVIGKLFNMKFTRQ